MLESKPIKLRIIQVQVYCSWTLISTHHKCFIMNRYWTILPLLCWMPVLQYKKRLLRSVTEYTNISAIIMSDTSVITRCHPSIIGESDHNASIQLSKTKTRYLHILCVIFAYLWPKLINASRLVALFCTEHTRTPILRWWGKDSYHYRGGQGGQKTNLYQQTGNM